MIGTLNDKASKNKDFKDKDPKDKASKISKIILFRTGWKKDTLIYYYRLHH